MKISVKDYILENSLLENEKSIESNILMGNIYIKSQKVSSMALKYSIDDLSTIEIRSKDKKYVSRAGYKLEHALDIFDLNLKDMCLLDVGSSTGGFVDVSLKNGIKKVVALDVGTNQLDFSLRNNDKVEVFEKTNFRTLKEDFFKEKFDYITMDVSFISVNLLIDNVINNLKKDGKFICLIKPQFELNKNVPRDNNGVILDKEYYKDLLLHINNNFIEKGLFINKVDLSPIKGKKGNVEFLTLCSFNKDIVINEDIINNLINTI
ncbi:MAG: TlyA family RNA methyltransferase [Mycoplasmatales bacterium]